MKTKRTKKQQKQLAKLDLLRSFYDENVDPFVLLRVAFIKDQNELLGMLNHKQVVQWACQCARSVHHLIDDENVKEKTNECLSLVEEWANAGNDNDKQPQLTAARNASDASYAALCASNAARWASNASARDAFDAARNAFDAALYASYAALCASDAALYASEAVIYASNVAHNASNAARNASNAAHYAFCTAELVSDAAHNASNVVINQQQRQEEVMNLRFLIEIAICDNNVH